MIELVLALMAATFIEGSGNMWTDGTYTWFGNQWCAEAGLLLAPDSPAIDQGAFIEGFHCPAPGPDPSGCVEWSGAAPDIGACEMVSTTAGVKIPNPPGAMTLE